MPNPIAGLRWKLLLLIVLSAALSAASAGVLFLATVVLYNIRELPFRRLIHTVHDVLGIGGAVWTAGIVMFFGFILLLSRRFIRDLTQITRTVREVAEGSFDRPLPVNGTDELAVLADSINRMSARLKASLEEERRAVQAKNELITSVSHDLRTPLTSIMGYLALIEEDRYKDEVELRYYVNVAHEKAHRLNRMVNDLFEYTRAAGGMRLERSEINLVELLGQVAADIGLQADKLGVAVRLEYADERIMVLADGDKLMRVFENLLSNAVQYGRSGKQVVVQASRAGKGASVRVVNFGPPIPALALPHIFDRFYRAEQSRSSATGGTGLGLAIAKSIVELHGGAIRAESSEQKTLFEVTLPGTGPGTD